MTRIAFDIGATHLRVGTIAPDGIVHIRRIDTPLEPDEAVRALATLAREDGAVEALYGGVPSIVDVAGTLSEATNLPSWNGFPFKEALARAAGAPVQVRNDAELAGLGEAAYGAGQGAARVAYLGLGTGIGTACIASARIEPHTSEGEGRRAVLTLADGTWLEDRIGGRALERAYGVPAEGLPAHVWSELTAYLAEGIANAMREWNPDAVVLGGSLVNEETGFQLEDVAAAVATRSGSRAPVRAAALKDASGLYGAKAWAETEPAA